MLSPTAVLSAAWFPRRSTALAVALAAAAGTLGGCVDAPAKVKPTYASVPLRDVPEYLKDSVYQYTDMTGTEPFPVSGYGLVANLRGTGGSSAPSPVRDFMVKELARHQMGSTGGGYESPDKILQSRDFSIVRVDALIPPGARSAAKWSTWMDVYVSALPQSDATSLAHGDLYECDLKVGGANPADPGNGMVDVKAQATGALFVNPRSVLDPDADTVAARAGRRSAIVLAGARAMEDRPLILKLRAPERRTARAIEQRINERFQNVADDDLQPHGNAAAKKVANAQDEALIYVYVPLLYADNWQHFAGVVRHLYVRGGDPAFAALKSRQLADAIVEPKAYTLDISYAWEGLGKPALFALQPLMSDPMQIERPVLGSDGKPLLKADGTPLTQTKLEHHPEIRFAAVRAAAFIGDPAAVPALLDIARTVGDPFRVNAVDVLGELPATPKVDLLCRDLLDSDEATVRIAAYRLLAKHRDPSIFTRWVRDGDKEIFALDVVRTTGRAGGGPPLITATQRGLPRIAIFGTETTLDLPLIFSTLEDNRLMISTTPDGDRVNVSYRSPYRRNLLGFTCRPDVPSLVALMSGDGNNGPSDAQLHLGYADVVAVLQSLTEQRKVSGLVGDDRLAASFVLGDPSVTGRAPVDTGPMFRGSGAGRPISDRGDATTQPGGDGDGLFRHAEPPVPN